MFLLCPFVRQQCKNRTGLNKISDKYILKYLLRYFDNFLSYLLKTKEFVQIQLLEYMLLILAFAILLSFKYLIICITTKTSTGVLNQIFCKLRNYQRLWVDLQVLQIFCFVQVYYE